MNFELIKKLKDARFSLRQGDIETEGIRYGLPSLEELIEACPTNIGKATFVLGSANQGKEWVACYFDFVTNRGSDFNETGSTPIEAVAKLWLALHTAGAALEAYDLPIGNIATLDGLAQFEANDVVVAAVDDVAVVEAAAEGTIEGAVRAGDFAGGQRALNLEGASGLHPRRFAADLQHQNKKTGE